eukprot:3679789-Prymnesium_polylepis.1
MRREPRRREGLVERRAAGGVEAEEPIEQLARRRRQAQVLLRVEAHDGRGDGAALALSVARALRAPVLGGVGALEGEEAEEHGEKADAERPHVRRECVEARLARPPVAPPRARRCYDLGRHVGPRAAPRVQLLAHDAAVGADGVLVGESPVDELEHPLPRPHAAREEHVLELQVAVRDAEAVRDADRLADLRKEGGGLALGEAAALDDVVEELAALHPLHHQAVRRRQLRRQLGAALAVGRRGAHVARAGRQPAVEAQHGGVLRLAEALHDARLARERLQPHPVLRDQLDRHVERAARERPRRAAVDLAVRARPQGAAAD